MSDFLADLRLALRTLRRAPGFAIAAVSTLALGIGANTAIFSVVKGVLLAPLGFPDAGRLVTLCEVNAATRGFCVASPPDVEDWARQSRTLGRIGLGRDWMFALTDASGTAGVNGGYATPGFFGALGVTPALGRLFADDEVGPAHANLALLSDEIWRSRFGADRDIVGRAIQLDHRPYTVIGVLPQETQIPHLAYVRVWTPLPFDPRDETNRNWRGFQVVARLAPAATLDDVRRDLGLIQRRLAEAHPETNAGWDVQVVPLLDSVVGTIRPTLVVFFAAVGLVLLIACVNVANLTLARGTSRHHEHAVRAALGAGRWRIVQRLLSEGLVLGAAGGVAGVVLAGWGLRAFLGLAPADIPRLDEVRIDGWVLAFAAGLSLFAAVLASVLPAVRTARSDPASGLREGGAQRVVGTRRRARDLLVALEVGLALMLVVSAALLTRSLGRLLAWDPGFDGRGVLVFWTFVSDGEYKTAPDVLQAYGQATAALRTVPGVTSLGMASAGPLFGGEETEPFAVDDRAAQEGPDRPVLRWYDVGPGYLETLGVPLLRGRPITDADVRNGPPVALVNATLAGRYWADGNPVGHRLRLLRREQTVEIVGVVADVPPLNPGVPSPPELYLPFTQDTRWASYIVLRTGGDPGAVVRTVRARLAEAVPGMDLSDFATMQDRMARELVRPRFTTFLLAVFALTALLLAALGTYGAVSYTVARRTREIGLRVALGADYRRVLLMVVRQGMVPVALGLAAGLAGAAAATRLLGRLLAGVGPRDPLAFLVAVTVLGGAGLLAIYLPARRAARVDPMEALRHE